MKHEASVPGQIEPARSLNELQAELHARIGNPTGEFGVVLMIGGNIPGETRVLAIALYDHIETLEYQRAHRLAGGMLLFSFILMLWLYGNRARLRLR